MPRLIWVFAGRTVILFVLSWGGSFSVENRLQKVVLCCLPIPMKIDTSQNNFRTFLDKSNTLVHVFIICGICRGEFNIFCFHILFSQVSISSVLSSDLIRAKCPRITFHTLEFTPRRTSTSCFQWKHRKLQKQATCSTLIYTNILV